MKRILLSLLCVMTAVFAGMAQTITSVIPSTNTVDLASSEQEVTLTISVQNLNSWATYKVNDGMHAQLLTSKDDVVGIECGIVKGDNFTMILTIPQTTPDGDYYLNIPAGCFQVGMMGTTKNPNWTSETPMFSISGGTGGGETVDYSVYFEDATISVYPTPEEGADLSEIAGFWISFPKLAGTDYALNIVDGSLITLSGDATLHVGSVDVKDGMPAVNCFVEGNAITKPGDYTVIVGAGAFRIGTALNEQFSATFTIPANEVQYVIDPSTSAVDGFYPFDSLIWVYFPEFADSATDVTVQNQFRIECTIGKDGVTYEKVGFTRDEDGWFVFQLPKIINPGEYDVTVTFGEGAVLCGADEIPNQEFSGTFKFKREYLSYTVTPDEGTTIDVEDFPVEFKIKFDQGVEFFGYWDEDGYNEIPVTAELKAGGDVCGSYVATLVDNNTLVVTMPEAVDPGLYTLTIPEAGVRSYNGIYVNKAFELNYTIGDSTSVEGIFDSAADSYTVVDCAGRVVVRNGSVEATRNLDKGIYIVNGKKTVIR